MAKDKLIKIKKPLVFSFLAFLLFVAGIAVDRNLLNQPTVNIPEGKLVILDSTKTIEVGVERVSDGDTIVIAGGERVRYLGINAPELMGKTT